MTLDLLAVGYSARSLVRSALSAGIEAGFIDAFADRDTVEPVPRPAWHRVLHPFDPARLASLAPPSRALAWTSNLENHPGILEELARGRDLIGNGASVLAIVRRAEWLEQVLAEAGLPYAATALAIGATSDDAWMIKPRASGGGHGVRPSEPGAVAGTDEYLQERIDGVAGSLLFLADGHDILPIGVTRQLVGDRAFGAQGYAWCGNLAGPGVLPRQDEVFESAVAAAAVIAEASGLRGLNGVDFIARGGEAVIIEVNPRWTASVELFERASGREFFSAHAAASRGELASPHGPSVGVQGKAVVFAEARWMAPATDAWLARGDVADVPRTGSVVAPGAPIATVLASAPDADTCYTGLVRAAREVFA